MSRSAYVALTFVLVVTACGGNTTATTTASAATTTAVPTTTVTPTTTLSPTTTTTTPTTTATPTTPTTTTTTAPMTTTTTTTTTAAPPTTTTAPATTTTTVDYVTWGSELATNLGCRNCHSVDGAAGLGPTWAGLGGSSVALSDGSAVTATAGYIAESIRSPDAKIVAGFNAGVMQSGYNSLSDDEIAALVAYVISR